MPSLPTPGHDEGTWGDILNDFLLTEHNPDGTLKLRTNGDLAAKADDVSVIHNSAMIAKGDLLVAQAAGSVARLPVGVDNQVLTADSSQTNGMRWKTPAANASLTWVPLSLPGDSGNYGAPYSPASAAIDSQGIVRLRGLISFSNTVNNGTVIASLPSNMWPVGKKLVMAIDAQSPGTLQMLIINTDGAITNYATMNTNNIPSLDGITFDTSA